ncbi:LexA family transcriptional regulator [Pseudomonas sp. X10]
MNSSGERLKTLLQECNLTASDFAAHRKVTPQHVNNWFKRGVPLARLDEFAELLCVHPRWLRTGEGPKHPSPLPRLCITRPGSAPEAGTLSGLMAHDGPDARIPFHRVHDGHLESIPGRHLRLPRQALDTLGVAIEHSLCLDMPAHNMNPVLPLGTLLAVDRSLTRIIPGETYALLHNGVLRIHTLSLGDNGALFLHSHDNHNYPTERYTAAQRKRQDLRIIGWVFWWSHLRPSRPD